jgi:hypothetical protein
LQPVGHEFLHRAIFRPTGYFNVGVHSIDDKEWRCLCCTAHGIVMAELGEGLEAGPVVLFVVYVGAEVLLEGRVYSLGLPHDLWVVGGAEILHDA